MAPGGGVNGVKSDQTNLSLQLASGVHCTSKPFRAETETDGMCVRAETWNLELGIERLRTDRARAHIQTKHSNNGLREDS
jgi:hypothetical protein